MACIFVFMLEENVAEFVEDIEVVDQGFQGQENFEQGKLPPNLQLCCYFPKDYTTKLFEKKNKTLSPMCDKIFCHST